MCMVVLSRPVSLLLSPVSRNSGASAMILHARLAENVELATDAHTHTHTHRALAGLVQRLTMGQTDAAELLNCMPTHCHRRIRLRSITSIRMRDNSAPRLFARAFCAVNTRRPSHEMRSRTVAAAAPNTLPTVTGHLPRPLVGLAG